jgi:hypothetical protein
MRESFATLLIRVQNLIDKFTVELPRNSFNKKLEETDRKYYLDICALRQCPKSRCAGPPLVGRSQIPLWLKFATPRVLEVPLKNK